MSASAQAVRQTLQARPPGKQTAARDTHGVPEGEAGPSRILHRDEHLFRTGDWMEGTYRIVAGVLKSYTVSHNGDERVLGFHMPGDIVGYEALVETGATCNVVALDTTNVRVMPIRSFATGEAKRDERATSAVVACMHEEIQRLAHLLQLERAPASQALAIFLLDHVSEQRLRGCSQRAFQLPMSRRDLANYLGVVPETLCRVLSRFRRDGLLALDGNLVTILDADRLRAEADPDECDHH